MRGQRHLAVLREVGKFDKRFLNSLQSFVKSEERDTLLDAAIGKIRVASSVPQTVITKQQVSQEAKLASSTTSGRNGISYVSYLIGIAILVIVYMLPVDTDATATLTTRFVTRTAEIAYLLILATGIISGLFSILMLSDTNSRSTVIMLIVLAAILLCVGSLIFWWRYAVAQAPLTFGGQFVILGASLAVIIVPLLFNVIANTFRRK